MISIIVAVADDWGIGRSNGLLWSIPEDLKRFRRLTTGKTVVMGKRTWESLPVKPLPRRRNIVISDIPGEVLDGASMAYSISEAAAMCNEDEEAFIIGGGSIYRQFLPLSDRLYITHIHSRAEADTYFPEISFMEWKIVSEESFPGGEKAPAYSYTIYERRSKDSSLP